MKDASKSLFDRSTIFAHLRLFLVFIAAWIWAPSAYAAGGSEIPPFPVRDSQAVKQVAKAAVVDTAGNVIVTGFRNLGGAEGDEYYTVKFRADGAGTLWERSYNHGSGSDTASAIAVDGNDNVIITGTVWSGSGTKIDIHTRKYDASGNLLWQRTWNNEAVNDDDYASTVAVDASGNIYVGGRTRSATDEDFLIVKYDADGNTQTLPWPVICDVDPSASPQDCSDSNTNDPDGINAIVIGSDGIVVTGDSQNDTQLDCVMQKYGFNGSLIREWRYSAGDGKDAHCADVKLDSAGNLFVAGSASNGSNTDIFTAKFDRDGIPAQGWQKTFDNGFADEAVALALDADGNVYVTGYTWTLEGRSEIWTEKRAGTDGAFSWRKTFGSAADNDDVAVPMGILVSDNVYVAGYTYKTDLENYDFQTLKYKKEDGTLLWQKSFDGTLDKNKDDVPVGLMLDPRPSLDDIYVAGWSAKVDELDSGVVTAGTTTWLSDPQQTDWTDNKWVNYRAVVTSGPNIGMERTIISNTTGTLIFSTADPFPSPLDEGATYYIYDPRDLDYTVIKYDRGRINRPTELTATAVSNTEILLTWQDNSNDETEFRIYRKTGEQGAYALISSPSNTTRYSDSAGLEPDTRYFYFITSYNSSAGESNPSNEANAVTRVVIELGPSWSKVLTGPGAGHDFATAIAVGPDNHPVMTGFGLNGEATQSDDYYTIKLDRASGEKIWDHSYNGDQGLDGADQGMDNRCRQR